MLLRWPRAHIPARAALHNHCLPRLCAWDHRLPDPRHRLCPRAPLVSKERPDGYIVDGAGRQIALPRGSSTHALLPYHSRSKMFVMSDRRRSLLDKRPHARAVE